MDQENKVLRFGAAIILCAIVFRLLSGGILAPVAELLQNPKAVELLMFLETGRSVRFHDKTEETGWTAESPAPELQITTEPPPAPVFHAQDLELVELRNSVSWNPDLEGLLTEPVNLALRSDAPTVLILHTHATESYTKLPGQKYTESGSYRTLDENYNLLRVGDELVRKLEAAGIHVIHDRSLHDYPSYNDSYSHARTSLKDYLAKYPSIDLVLDIHRDAADTASGQLATNVSNGEIESAQLMLVMGTGANGQSHPNWRQNLSLALKLQVQLERFFPGICRPLSLRGSRFNQDLHPNMVLVEVGAAGDTLEEALAAIDPLAQAIISLSG